jgi:hypothetical protein
MFCLDVFLGHCPATCARERMIPIVSTITLWLLSGLKFCSFQGSFLKKKDTGVWTQPHTC